MKKILLMMSAATLIFLTACTENESSKTEGGEQLDAPVMNSGANTEGRRAVEAVSDSASDSGVVRDKDAMSTPH